MYNIHFFSLLYPLNLSLCVFYSSFLLLIFLESQFLWLLLLSFFRCDFIFHLRFFCLLICRFLVCLCLNMLNFNDIPRDHGFKFSICFMEKHFFYWILFLLLAHSIGAFLLHTYTLVHAFICYKLEWNGKNVEMTITVKHFFENQMNAFEWSMGKQFRFYDFWKKILNKFKKIRFFCLIQSYTPVWTWKKMYNFQKIWTFFLCNIFEAHGTYVIFHSMAGLCSCQYKQ